MAKSWFFSNHALERFLERVDPTLDEADARRFLAELPFRDQVVLVGYQGKKRLYREVARPNRAEYVVLKRTILTVLDPQQQPLEAGRESIVATLPRGSQKRRS